MAPQVNKGKAEGHDASYLPRLGEGSGSTPVMTAVTNIVSKLSSRKAEKSASNMSQTLKKGMKRLPK